jgi:transcription antitermination factor NusA-like protein
VVVRLLVSPRNAAFIIGKSGANVMELQDASGARIRVSGTGGSSSSRSRTRSR